MRKQSWLARAGKTDSKPDHDEPLVLDETYISWLKEHPSAISSFQRMINASKGKQIVVFLDYDGTLSPIVCDPDRAFMSDQMREAVRDVSKHFPTAIISGRSREKMLVETRERTKNIKGVVIEDNMFCLAVHYRHVKYKEYERLEKEIELMLVNFPQFHITRGKKVLEIRPSIDWNKGHAVEYILDNLGYDDSRNFLPIYIGDDKTDEDAFKVLRERGEGFPIVVSSKPRKTMAFHSLHDPSEVLSFLIRLGKWGSKQH